MSDPVSKTTARRHDLLAIAAAVIYWMTSAHAQEPMVQCHLGSSARVVLASVCPMLKNAFAKLRFDGGGPNALQLSTWQCAEVITQQVHPEYQPTPGYIDPRGAPAEFVPICTQMWQREMYTRAGEQAAAIQAERQRRQQWEWEWRRDHGLLPLQQ